ncbi:phosphate ABC transporter substrate-binding protein PstS [Burkholderiaceae bacterium UC74_6]
MPFLPARLLPCLLSAITLTASLATTAHAEVTGAGATFRSLVYARWAEAYQKTSGGVAVSYKPTGSGDGVKQISARSVGFGGSDSPLSAEELAKRRLVQIPMLVGGVVPVVNLPGVPEGKLRLTGEVLADIEAGRIKTWNDIRLVVLNSGQTLPALPIRRVVRAEKSGTTEGLTRYLSAVSRVFAAEVGVSQLPTWPGEVERAEGNDGMVKAIKATPGAIGYASFDRVQQAHLNAVRLRNADGEWVAASEAGFRSAIAASDLARQGDDLAPLIDRPGAESWPITMTSFVLIDARPAKSEAAGPVMRFLYWSFMHGDDLTKGTGFAPLPVKLQSKLAARFSAVRSQDGKVPDYQVL